MKTPGSRSMPRTKAEKFHEKMFAEALADLANVPDKTFYVCQVCGMTYEDGVPERLCGLRRSEEQDHRGRLNSFRFDSRIVTGALDGQSA